MDAGKADAKILIESMAHFGDHLLDEGRPLFFFPDRGGEHFSHFEDDGEGEGIVIDTAADDGMPFDIGLHLAQMSFRLALLQRLSWHCTKQ